MGRMRALAAAAVAVGAAARVEAGRDASVFERDVTIACEARPAPRTASGVETSTFLCALTATVTCYGVADFDVPVSARVDSFAAAFDVAAGAGASDSPGAYSALLDAAPTMLTCRGSGNSTTVSTTWANIVVPGPASLRALVAYVMVDPDNVVEEVREGADNLARRNLYGQGLPSILAVDPELRGYFVYGVDLLNRIYVTLDAPLPRNGELRLGVAARPGEIVASTSTLARERKIGGRSFFEYELVLGMGIFDGTAFSFSEASPRAAEVYAWSVRVVYVGADGATMDDFATPREGLVRFSPWRSVISDFVALAVPRGTADRAWTVGATMLRKEHAPWQRRAGFYLSGTVTGDRVLTNGVLRTVFADPAGFANLTGGLPFLAGVYGAEFSVANFSWSYYSDDASATVTFSAARFSVTVAGATIDYPVVFAFDGGTGGLNELAMTYQAVSFTTAAVAGAPRVPLTVFGAPIAVPTRAGGAVTYTPFWWTRASTGDAIAAFSGTINYVRTTTTVPPTSVPFVARLFLAQSFTDFYIRGPFVSHSDDTGALSRLDVNIESAPTVSNVGGGTGAYVRFYLAVSAGSLLVPEVDFQVPLVRNYVEVQLGAALTPPATPLTTAAFTRVFAATSGATATGALPAALPPARATTTLVNSDILFLDTNTVALNNAEGGPTWSGKVDQRHAMATNAEFSRVAVAHDGFTTNARLISRVAIVNPNSPLTADGVRVNPVNPATSTVSNWQSFQPSSAFVTRDILWTVSQVQTASVDASTAASATSNLVGTRNSSELFVSRTGFDGSVVAGGDATNTDPSWRLTNNTVFDGFPTIAAWYAYDAFNALAGQSAAVVWVRDTDGDINGPSNWADASIMWAGYNFTTATWSAAAALPGGAATTGRMALVVDAAAAVVAYVSAARRVQVAAWRLDGAGAVGTAAVPAESFAPVLLRDAVGAGFTLAWQGAGGAMSYARGTIDVSAAGVAVTLGAAVAFPAGATSAAGATALAGTRTPYGHALVWATRVGLAVSELDLSAGAATFSPPVIANVDANGDAGQLSATSTATTVTAASTSGTDYWPVAGRTRNLVVGYVDRTSPAWTATSALFHAFSGVSFVMTSDRLAAAPSATRLVTGYLSPKLRVVNATFPDADTPASRFLVRVTITNVGASRSFQSQLNALQGGATNIGQVVVPPLLAGASIEVDLFVNPLQTLPTFALDLTVDQAPAHAQSHTLTVYPNNVFISNLVTDSIRGVSFLVTNSGPLRGDVAISAAAVDATSNVGSSALLTTLTLEPWGVATVVYDPLSRSALEMARVLGPSGVVRLFVSGMTGVAATDASPATVAGRTAALARDRFSWDNVAVAPGVHEPFRFGIAAGDVRVAQDPNYRATGTWMEQDPSRFVPVAAVGITNLGRAPIQINGLDGTFVPLSTMARRAIDAPALGFTSPLTATAATAWSDDVSSWYPRGGCGGACDADRFWTCDANADSDRALPGTKCTFFYFRTLFTGTVNGNVVPNSGLYTGLAASQGQPASRDEWYRSWRTEKYFLVSEPADVASSGTAGAFFWGAGSSTTRSLAAPYTGAHGRTVALPRAGTRSLVVPQCQGSAAGCFTRNDAESRTYFDQAMWRPSVDTIGIPLQVLQTSRPFTTAGRIANISLFVELESANCGTSPNGAGYATTASTATGATNQCFDINTQAGSIEFQVWRRQRTTWPDGRPRSADWRRVWSDTRTLTSAGYNFIDLGVWAPPARNTYGSWTGAIDFAPTVLPGDIFGWFQPHDNAVRVRFSNATDGRDVNGLAFARYAGRTQQSARTSIAWLQDSELQRFDAPRVYSIEVGFQAAGIPRGEVGVTVDLERNLTTVTIQARPTAIQTRTIEDFSVTRQVRVFVSDADDVATNIHAVSPIMLSGNHCTTVSIAMTPRFRQRYLERLDDLKRAIASGLYNGSNPEDVRRATAPAGQTPVFSDTVPSRSFSFTVTLGDPDADDVTALNNGRLATTSVFIAQTSGLLGQWNRSQCVNGGRGQGINITYPDRGSALVHFQRSDTFTLEATVQSSCARVVQTVSVSSTCNDAPVAALTGPPAFVLMESRRDSAFEAGAGVGPYFVSFNASTSSDVNGDELRYRWRAVVQPTNAVAISGASPQPAVAFASTDYCGSALLTTSGCGDWTPAAAVNMSYRFGGDYVVQVDVTDGCSVASVNYSFTVGCPATPATALIDNIAWTFSARDSAAVVLSAESSNFFLNSETMQGAWDVPFGSASIGTRALPDLYDYDYEWRIVGTTNPSARFVETAVAGTYSCFATAAESASIVATPAIAAAAANAPSTDAQTGEVRQFSTTGTELRATAIDTNINRAISFAARSASRVTATSADVSVFLNNTAAAAADTVTLTRTGPRSTLTVSGNTPACRGPFIVAVRAIDRCRPQRVGEARTTVALTCPPPPVASAGCSLGVLRAGAVFPTVTLRSAWAPPPGATARWFPANAAARAVWTSTSYADATQITPTSPGAYAWELRVDDACLRDRVANDTIVVNAICRAWTAVVPAAATGFAGVAVTLSANTSLPLTAVAGVGAFGVTTQSYEVATGLTRTAARFYEVSQVTITVAWTLTSKPATSARSGADITNPASLTPHFTPDRPGTYVFRATISDGCSQPQLLNVTLTVGCRAPVAGAILNDDAARTDCQYSPAVAAPASFTTTFRGVARGFRALWASSAPSTVAGTPFDALGAAAGQSARTWNLVSKPAASLVAVGVVTPAAIFTPDVAGTYALQLNVTDGCIVGSTLATFVAVCNPLAIAATYSAANASVAAGATLSYSATTGEFPRVTASGRAYYTAAMPFPEDSPLAFDGRLTWGVADAPAALYTPVTTYDVAANGGFETGSLGNFWAWGGGTERANYVPKATTYAARTGAWSMLLGTSGVAEVAGTTFAAQTIYVPADAAAVFVSFSYLPFVPTGAGEAAALRFARTNGAFADASGVVFDIVTAVAPDDSRIWKGARVNLAAVAGGIAALRGSDVAFNFTFTSNGNGVTSYVLIDDFRVEIDVPSTSFALAPGTRARSATGAPVSTTVTLARAGAKSLRLNVTDGCASAATTADFTVVCPAITYAAGFVNLPSPTAPLPAVINSTAALTQTYDGAVFGYNFTNATGAVFFQAAPFPVQTSTTYAAPGQVHMAGAAWNRQTLTVSTGSPLLDAFNPMPFATAALNQAPFNDSFATGAPVLALGNPALRDKIYAFTHANINGNIVVSSCAAAGTPGWQNFSAVRFALYRAPRSAAAPTPVATTTQNVLVNCSLFHPATARAPTTGFALVVGRDASTLPGVVSGSNAGATDGISTGTYFLVIEGDSATPAPFAWSFDDSWAASTAWAPFGSPAWTPQSWFTASTAADGFLAAAPPAATGNSLALFHLRPQWFAGPVAFNFTLQDGCSQATSVVTVTTACRGITATLSTPLAVIRSNTGSFPATNVTLAAAYSDGTDLTTAAPAHVAFAFFTRAAPGAVRSAAAAISAAAPFNATYAATVPGTYTIGATVGDRCAYAESAVSVTFACENITTAVAAAPTSGAASGDGSLASPFVVAFQGAALPSLLINLTTTFTQTGAPFIMVPARVTLSLSGPQNALSQISSTTTYTDAAALGTGVHTYTYTPAAGAGGLHRINFAIVDNFSPACATANETVWVLVQCGPATVFSPASLASLVTLEATGAAVSTLAFNETTATWPSIVVQAPLANRTVNGVVTDVFANPAATAAWFVRPSPDAAFTQLGATIPAGSAGAPRVFDSATLLANGAASGAVTLRYTVNDGCQIASLPFTLPTACGGSRSIDTAAVVTSYTTYWNSARWMNVTLDVGTARFVNASGLEYVPRRWGAFAPNVTLLARPVQSSLAAGSAFATAVGDAYTVLFTPDLNIPQPALPVGPWTFAFVITDGCNTANVSVSVLATCPAITAVAGAQTAISPQEADVMRVPVAAATPETALVVPLTGWAAPVVRLTAAASTVADYPRRTLHALNYSWAVLDAPAGFAGTNWWATAGVVLAANVSFPDSGPTSVSPAVRLPFPGFYRFAVTVSDGCTSSVALVHVNVTCVSPLDSGAVVVNARNAIAYWNPTGAGAGSFRKLRLTANATKVADSCSAADSVRFAWTYNGTIAAQGAALAFTPETTLDSVVYGQRVAFARAFDRSLTAGAQLVPAAGVTLAVQAIDFCYARRTLPVTVTPSCTPFTLPTDTGVLDPEGAAAAVSYWSPKTRFNALRTGVTIAYSAAAVDPQEDANQSPVGLPTDNNVGAAASVAWDLVSAPAGSRLALNANGCTTVQERSTRTASVLAVRQVCPAAMDAVWEVLESPTGADTPLGTLHAGNTGVRAGAALLAVKVIADVPGAYVVRARVSDGCGFASQTLTVTATCRTIAPALAVSTPLRIPVGAAAGWAEANLDGSGTAYTGGSLADSAALAPRFYITSAPSGSIWNASWFMLNDARARAANAPARALPGGGAALDDADGLSTAPRGASVDRFRVSANFTAVVNVTSKALGALVTASADFTELTNVNGLDACFTPDAPGTYAVRLDVSDACPTGYNAGGQLVVQNASATAAVVVVCEGAVGMNVSTLSRSVTANSSQFTRVPLAPRELGAAIPDTPWLVGAWQMLSWPAGHAATPMDLTVSYNPSSFRPATAPSWWSAASVIGETLRLSLAAVPREASFVPTVAGTYTFSLTMMDPRCPGSVETQTVTINVECAALSVTPATATLLSPFDIYDQRDVQTARVDVRLAGGSEARPARVSWRVVSATGVRAPGSSAGRPARGIFSAVVTDPSSTVAGVAAAPVAATPAPASSSSSGLSGGAIAGIVIACVVGAAVLGALVYAGVKSGSSAAVGGAAAAKGPYAA